MGSSFHFFDSSTLESSHWIGVVCCPPPPPPAPNQIPRPCPPPPPRVTFRLVVAPFRGPGQSPVLPFACCVGSLLSVGRCGRCSCWCRFRRFRVRRAQWLVCWGCAGCGGMCRLRVTPPRAPWGGGSPSDSLGGGGGDCKGISRQSVVPSTDASKQNTGEATVALMRCECHWGSTRMVTNFRVREEQTLNCCTCSVCMTGTGCVARANDEEATGENILGLKKQHNTPYTTFGERISTNTPTNAPACVTDEHMHQRHGQYWVLVSHPLQLSPPSRTRSLQCFASELL